MHGGSPVNEGDYSRHGARLALARRDLDDARTADLATLSPTELVLMVERLRSSLYDTLLVVDELTGRSDQ